MLCLCTAAFCVNDIDSSFLLLYLVNEKQCRRKFLKHDEILNTDDQIIIHELYNDSMDESKHIVLDSC